MHEGTGTLISDLPRADIEAQISKAIGYITQRLTATKPKTVDAWDLFKRLRQTAPSPFGAYIAAADDFHLLSASPERFLKVGREG